MANLSNINGKFVVEQTTGYVGVIVQILLELIKMV
jgi:hypothetical protein